MAGTRGDRREDTGRTTIVGAAPRVPKRSKGTAKAFKRADERIAAFKKSVSKK